MRWATMWDNRQGIYLGIEDPRNEDYAFLYGGDRSGAAVLGAWQRTLAKPQSTWQSPTFRVALTAGDWHDAADIYREYLTRTLKATEVHPVVKWLMDAWSQQPSNEASSTGWDMIRPEGEMVMAANGQMLDGADPSCCGSYPLPSLAWGSFEEFSQKLAVRRALGGFYTPYLNFHLWAPGYGHYKRIGSFPRSRIPPDVPVPGDEWYKNATAKNYDGSFPRVETDRFAQVGMAMGSHEWRDWLMYWTHRYLRWGADGMYYDQFNMSYGNGWLYPDFDTYGNWLTAELDTITKIRINSRSENTYFMSSGEGCNDLYGQELDMHMTSGVWNRLEFFRYTVPDQILVDGIWNGGLSPNLGGPERLRFIWQVGARFDHVPRDKRLLTLRRAVKTALYDSTFRDTVGLTLRDSSGRVLTPQHTYMADKWENAPVKGVIARWFLINRKGQQGAIVNFINAPVVKGARCALSTKEFGPVTSAWAVTIDGDWLPVTGKQQGNVFTFEVPQSECSSVILSGRLLPLVEWELQSAATQGVDRKLTLKITNPTAQSIAGTARLRVPPGWTVPAAVNFGPISTGETQWSAITFHVPENASKGRTDIWCDLTTPSGTFSAYNLVVVNEPVIADFRGNPGNYHIWLKNLTDKQTTAAVVTYGGTTLKAFSSKTPFTVPPQAEMSLPIDVAGQDSLREITELTGIIKVGSQTLRVVRGVIPTVPNGNFETDGAGDLKPDWWMCRSQRDVLAYERVHLAGAAHNGKYCLQLDAPQENEKFTRAYPIHTALRAGARYQASIWIKADSAKGVYASIAGRVLGSGQTKSGWQQFSIQFEQGDGPQVDLNLINGSSEPAFFDDVTIMEVPNSASASTH